MVVVVLVVVVVVGIGVVGVAVIFACQQRIWKFVRNIRMGRQRK